MPMVEFRGVSYSVGGTSILHGIDLEIQPGELLILLGESGCGKTTTLKLINRLIEPTSGSVSRGRAVTPRPAVTRRPVVPRNAQP